MNLLSVQLAAAAAEPTPAAPPSPAVATPDTNTQTVQSGCNSLTLPIHLLILFSTNPVIIYSIKAILNHLTQW